MAHKNKKKKQAKKKHRRHLTKTKHTQGISLAAWNNPGEFYNMGLLIFEKTPVALTEKNLCPNCARIDCKRRKKQIVTPDGKKAFKFVYECDCNMKLGTKFVFRPFAKKGAKSKLLTPQTLPKTMSEAKYNALPEALSSDGKCVNPECFKLESILFWPKSGKGGNKVPVFFCEYCGFIMRPHADFEL